MCKVQGIKIEYGARCQTSIGRLAGRLAVLGHLRILCLRLVGRLADERREARDAVLRELLKAVHDDCSDFGGRGALSVGETGSDVEFLLVGEFTSE
jgi:hypothetical protein